MLSLYSHAYQSYVWNRVVSERARLYGSHKPLVGDIVLVENEKKDVSKRDSKRDRVGRRDFNNVKWKEWSTEEFNSFFLAQSSQGVDWRGCR